MGSIDNQKPVLSDRQSFADGALANAVAWSSSPTAALSQYNDMMQNYDQFILAFSSLSDEVYSDLPFISEDIKPYS